MAALMKYSSLRCVRNDMAATMIHSWETRTTHPCQRGWGECERTCRSPVHAEQRYAPHAGPCRGVSNYRAGGTHNLSPSGGEIQRGGFLSSYLKACRSMNLPNSHPPFDEREHTIYHSPARSMTTMVPKTPNVAFCPKMSVKKYPNKLPLPSWERACPRTPIRGLR